MVVVVSAMTTTVVILKNGRVKDLDAVYKRRQDSNSWQKGILTSGKDLVLYLFGFLEIKFKNNVSISGTMSEGPTLTGVGSGWSSLIQPVLRFVLV